jgi:hypothetical protein
MADFPAEMREVLEGAKPSALGACLHVSRNLIPSAAVWPMTVPDDEAVLEIATTERLSRAATAARTAVEGLAPAPAPD